jgi:peptidoglycan hydrolase CwlO-like protein
MHLLLETALGDSREFEVLSFEELEELKKDHLLISKRAEATKRNLLLESKVRDAAHSLSRLSSRAGRRAVSGGSAAPQSRHRGLANGESNNNHSLHPNDSFADEYALSQRRCEELAQQLWHLEMRASENQKKILQHTAGILSRSYRASSAVDGVSSEGAGHELVVYGDNRTPRSDGIVGDGKGQRSSQFLLQGANGDRKRPHAPSGHNTDQLLQTIRTVEQRLAELNHKLRAVISDFDPPPEEPYQAPPESLGDGLNDKAQHLQAQLQYIDLGLEVVHHHQRENARYIRESEDAMKASLSLLSDDLHQIMTEANIPDSQYESTQNTADLEMHTQLNYLQGGLQSLRSKLKSGARNGALQNDAAQQYETVVRGLWDIIITGEADAHQRRQEREIPKSPDGGPDGATGNKEPLVVEPYSLQNFSTKIQWLYARSEKLEQEKDILRRQIQQQRELSQASDSTKDTIVTQLTEELERAKLDLQKAHKEALHARQETAATLQRLEAARRELGQLEQQQHQGAERAERAERDTAAAEAAAVNAASALAEHQAELRRLEAQLREAQSDGERARSEMQSLIRNTESRMRALRAEAQTAAHENESLRASHDRLTQQADEKDQQVEAARADLRRLEGEVVRLQTEATMARAELDGAYGARQRRAPGPGAGAGAANGTPGAPNLQKEMDELARRNMSLLEEIAAFKTIKQSESSSSGDLQHRVDKLQKELAETIDEYEAMTRQSVEFEKDREQLENTIDSLRERCEAAEIQLNDEKLKWLGTTAAGGAGGGGKNGNVSTAVLRDEFRKMMKEMKAESVKALRVSLSSFVPLSLRLITTSPFVFSRFLSIGGFFLSLTHFWTCVGGARRTSATRGAGEGAQEGATTRSTGRYAKQFSLKRRLLLHLPFPSTFIAVCSDPFSWVKGRFFVTPIIVSVCILRVGGGGGI